MMYDAPLMHHRAVRIYREVLSTPGHCSLVRQHLKREERQTAARLLGCFLQQLHDDPVDQETGSW